MSSKIQTVPPPELTGGAGFTFEGAVSALYLTHLLAETAAPGDADRIVVRVALGQRGFGEPLDDLVVDLAGLGASARLSLQVKRSLTISRAKSNADFRAVIKACWETLIKGDFRHGVDRYGVVVGEAAASKTRALQTLCELARESLTKENFEARFTPDGHVGSNVLAVKNDIEVLLTEMEGMRAAAEIHQFLAHFVLIKLDFLHEGACDPPQAVNRIRDYLATEDIEKAPLVWSRLLQIARESAGRSGEFDRARLLRSIAPLTLPRRADVSALVDMRRAFLLSMREHCEQLPQVDLTSRLGDAYVALSLDRCDGGGEERRGAHRMFGKTAEHSLIQSGNHLIEGVAGSGKSTLARRLVIACADALLKRPSESLETVRLPALVPARAIVETRGSFSDAVRRAIVDDMAFAGVAEPPARFFHPGAPDGHASWLLVVDGLDEVADGAQRQKLWDSLVRYAQTSECFRFIVTSRPGAVDVRDGSAFARWLAAPLEAASWRAIAGRHLGDEKMLERFAERMDRPDHAEIVRLPLFITMAADVFRRHPDLPTLSSDLCDLFARHMLNKVPDGTAGVRSAVERLLEVYAVDSAPNLLRLAESEPRLLDAFGPSSLLPLEFEVEAKKTLAKCGFGRFVGSEFRFNHDLLRSRFAARALSRTSKPSEKVWDSIDPFKAGWAAVEQVCISWDRAGEAISPAIRGLLSYGEDGLRCAVGVITACPSVGDREVREVTDRLIRSMLEFGPFVWVLDALTRIARGRVLVRKRLLDFVYQHDDWIGDRAEVLECLLKAGHRDDAMRALKRLCRSEDCYGSDRIRAAELLLQSGEREIAAEALAYEMENGEEAAWRLDAACVLLEAEPSPRTRRAVRDLLDEAENTGETVYETTLGRLLKLGEEDLALAALRQIARPGAKGRDRDVPWTAIRASRELAAWDRDEGIRALVALLAHEDYSLRGRAEVIEALHELGETTLAFEAMQRALASANDEQIDWFVVDVMRTLDMRDEAAALGKRAIGRSLRGDDPWRNWKDLFDHLYGWCDLTDLLDPLTLKLEAEPSTNVAGALARLGRRDAAIATLRRWCSHWDPRKVLDAAGALAELGSRDQALRTANRIAQDASIAPEHRLSAAEILKSADMFPQSVRLYRLLMRDRSLPMKLRCRAASALSEIGKSTRAIWRTLWDYLLDERNRLRDRLAAAEQLLQTEEDECFDYDRYDVDDILLSMLDDANLTALERLEIGKMLARRRFNLSEMSAVLPALEPCAAPMVEVLSFLSEVSVFARDSAADLKALEIIERDAPPWRIVIETCSHIHAPDAELVAQARLAELAADPMAPPAWRREGAKALHRADPALGGQVFMKITADLSISVRERRLALEKLAAGDRQIMREGLLDLSGTPDLSFWERMTLVELAIEIGALDLARDFLDAARLDAPLSIAEIVALAKKYLDIGAEDSAGELLNELISLSQAILAATEDTHEFLEAARLFVKMGREPDAVLFLTTLLDQGHACSYETPHILRALAAVATSADLRIVLGQCEVALAQELDDPDLDYVGAHLQLWLCLDELSADADKALLWQIVLNEKVYLGSRLEACALLVGRDARSASEARATARRLFEQTVVENRSEALAHAATFGQCGLGGEVSALIERSIGDAALDPPALRNLAEILQRRGERIRAEDCLKRARALDPKEPVHFLQQRIVESIEGRECCWELLRERFCDGGEELYERLEYARDLVDGNGDQQAWRLLIDTLGSPSVDVGTRLRAAELLDELELRDLPREVANELRCAPDVDDYWIGDFLLRIGRKRDAAVSFERAITTCPKDYAHQIAARLADLRADSLLFRLETAE